MAITSRVSIFPPTGRQLVAVAVLCVVVSAAGCGSDAYQKKYDAALTQQKGRSQKIKGLVNAAKRFQDAHDELQDEPQYLHGDWPLLLRRPSVFIPVGKNPAAQPYVEGDPHRYDDGTISPQRLHPPFMSSPGTQLPGFLRCWESLVKDEKSGEYTPYYMYVAVVPALAPAEEAGEETGDETDDGPAEGEAAQNSPADEILAKVKTALGDQVPDAWEEIGPPSLEWDHSPGLDDSQRAHRKWKRLSIEADQEFLVYKNPQETAVAESLPGRFDICLYEGRAFHVIIAWRVPLKRDVEEDFDLDAIQAACLGTLQGADVRPTEPLGTAKSE